MIDVYFWPTPNGYKITWMLEEVGLKYNVIPVNIGAGDQFKPEFLKISPNNRMPAITDPDGPGGKPISIFESGAILMYLAEKTGKLMPSDTRGKYNVIQWLMFQMASVGPMLGQAHHFRRYAPEKIEYAINRYTNEAKRIYGSDRQAPGRSEVPGGRLLDRRYRDLPVAGAAFDAGTGARRFSESEEMVRRAARAAGDSARLRRDERGRREDARGGAGESTAA